MPKFNYYETRKNPEALKHNTSLNVGIKFTLKKDYLNTFPDVGQVSRLIIKQEQHHKA
jgi:hypothetical protein